MADLEPPLPTRMQIEVTGSCNLRCKMCLVSYRPALGRREGSLSLDLFRRVVDENPRLEEITLQGLGEPLLAPDLLAMIEHAAGRGIRMGFNTNGMLLTSQRAERLIRAGLAWLHVSVDGATAPTFEGIRDMARFDTVVGNLRELVRLKRQLSSSLPYVQVNFVAMRRNFEELPALVGLAGEWGVDRLWVQNLSHTFDDTDPQGDYREIREFAEGEALWTSEDRAAMQRVFVQAREIARMLGLAIRLPGLTPDAASGREEGQPGCDWPWLSTYVGHDGKIQPCCMVMGSDRAQLGDVSSQSLVEVWSGKRYSDFRAALLSESPPQVCRSCSAYRGVF
jgi:radical SAM protein with 4Fe4S-binding SPASM domain